jgi:hypothetical protein
VQSWIFLGRIFHHFEGAVQLCLLMSKKRTLEMMECIEEFVDGEVLETVHQRTDKVKNT